MAFCRNALNVVKDDLIARVDELSRYSDTNLDSDKFFISVSLYHYVL